jgi:hypothetical protein
VKLPKYTVIKSLKTIMNQYVTHDLDPIKKKPGQR